MSKIISIIQFMSIVMLRGRLSKDEILHAIIQPVEKPIST
jgi:hypothetical protein